MPSTSVSIQIVAGSTAPRLEEGTSELELAAVMITEQGTEQGLPIIDLRCVDQDGKQFLITVTGRLLAGIAAAVRGINTRIHGRPEP